MIREINSNYLQQCVEIAFLRNSQPENNCAYCPKEKSSIHGDFSFLMGNPDNLMLGYFDGDTLVGIFGFFISPENNWVDCVGPFFKDEWNQEAAKEMFDYSFSKFTQAVRFNFYFNTKNENLHKLAELLSAERNDNEYILLLKKADYKPQDIKHTVVMYEYRFRSEFIRIFNDTFPVAYILPESVIDAIGKDREVFCALDEKGVFVGYGVLKFYDNPNHATAEIFGVDENARGKGYGWAVLNATLEYALNKHNTDTVDLIVDKLNTHASELYYSCGFKLMVENAAYCIKNRANYTYRH